MAKTKTYGHYCAAARALEVIGEKWSLLVVRDLLDGPQRFSDLARTLGGITPKLLTLRLRDLEASGVVERNGEEGRREVWYRLTPAGEALRPVIEQLLIWGVEHGKPPEPGEPVYHRRGIGSLVAIFNRDGIKPGAPTAWALHLAGSTPSVALFDGERWKRAFEADPAIAKLTIETDAATWIGLLRSRGDDRDRHLSALKLTGEASQIVEFRRLLSAKA